MATIKNIESEIEKLQARLAELKKEEAAFNAMGPIEQLAVDLHDTFCDWNHTDGCSWEYEYKNGAHDWSGNAHTYYRLKAARIHSNFLGDTIQISEFLKLTKELGL